MQIDMSIHNVIKALCFILWPYKIHLNEDSRRVINTAFIMRHCICEKYGNDKSI